MISTSSVVPVAVAAFDVDHTLTRHDCVGRFLVSVGGRRAIVAALARRPQAVATALVRRDRDALKEIVVGGVLRGRRVADVDARGRAFAAEVMFADLRPDVLARLRWHQRRGDRVVLVSASLGPYLRPFGAALGVDGVLCADILDADGVYGDRLDGANCRTEEKAVRLRTWLAAEGLVADRLWAYGDSTGDTALLAMAAQPVWVGRAVLDAAPTEPI